jgi:hypothetical protein
LKMLQEENKIHKKLKRFLTTGIAQRTIRR